DSDRSPGAACARRSSRARGSVTPAATPRAHRAARGWQGRSEVDPCRASRGAWGPRTRRGEPNSVNIDYIDQYEDGMLITAREAARRLGVKPATLYAYVSRGLIRSAASA